MECASKSTVVMYKWLQQVAVAINSHTAKWLLLAVHSTLANHVSQNGRNPSFAAWREVKAVCSMFIVSKGQGPALLRMVSPSMVLLYRCCVPVMSWSSLSIFVYEKEAVDKKAKTHQLVVFLPPTLSLFHSHARTPHSLTQQRDEAGKRKVHLPRK